MTLTVEDGTAKPDADAFISLAYFKAYCDKHGHAYGSGDDLIEQAIVRASAFLSGNYTWAGRLVKPRNTAGGAQALAWPRSGVVDGDGYSVPETSLPGEIERATTEFALRELANPGAMTPDYTPSERVKSERVDVIAVEYDMSRTDAESVQPVLLLVRKWIGPFLASGVGSTIQGSAVRV